MRRILLAAALFADLGGMLVGTALSHAMFSAACERVSTAAACAQVAACTPSPFEPHADERDVSLPEPESPRLEFAFETP